MKVQNRKCSLALGATLCLTLSLLLLTSCQDNPASPNSPAASTSTTQPAQPPVKPAAPTTPPAPTATAESSATDVFPDPPSDLKPLLHTFPDGHRVAIEFQASYALLIPPQFQGDLQIAVQTSALQLLKSKGGATWTEKCRTTSDRVNVTRLAAEKEKDPAFKQTLLNAAKSLIGWSEKQPIGMNKLVLAGETNAFAEQYLKANWPAGIPRVKTLLAIDPSGAHVHVQRSTMHDGLTTFLNQDYSHLQYILGANVPAFASIYCDMLLGKFELYVKFTGLTEPIPVTLQESAQGVRP